MASFNVKVLFCAPLDPSMHDASAPFEVDVYNAFTALIEEPSFPVVGNDTTVVPLGAVPATGLRGFVLMLDPTGAPSPISVSWTYVDASTGGVKEVTAAIGAPGVIAIFSAAPTNGIVSVSVTHTSNAMLRMIAVA